MKDLNPDLWKSVFEPDQGALLNIRAYGTDQGEYERFFEFVKSRYPISYSENGSAKSLPQYEVIVKKREFCSIRLSINAGGIVLNSFFGM